MSQIPIDADDIAGVVRSSRGPEAGVWVIAETTDTPTKFRKIVVTDDQGRYLLPDLPGRRATYRVWVRGYGLVDSTPVRATPGRRVALTAVLAADARAAARIYPANYWYSLINIPPFLKNVTPSTLVWYQVAFKNYRATLADDDLRLPTKASLPPGSVRAQTTL